MPKEILRFVSMPRAGLYFRDIYPRDDSEQDHSELLALTDHLWNCMLFGMSYSNLEDAYIKNCSPLVNVLPERMLYFSKKPEKSVEIPFKEIHSALHALQRDLQNKFYKNIQNGLTAIVIELGFVISVNKGKRFFVSIPLYKNENDIIDASLFQSNTKKGQNGSRHKYHAEQAIKYFLEKEENVQNIIDILFEKIAYNRRDKIKIYEVILFLNSNNSPCNEPDTYDRAWKIQYHKNCTNILANLQSCKDDSSFLNVLKRLLLMSAKNIIFPKNNGSFPRMIIHSSYKKAYNCHAYSGYGERDAELIDIKLLSGQIILATNSYDLHEEYMPETLAMSKISNKPHSLFVNV